LRYAAVSRRLRLQRAESVKADDLIFEMPSSTGAGLFMMTISSRIPKLILGKYALSVKFVLGLTPTLIISHAAGHGRTLLQGLLQHFNWNNWLPSSRLHRTPRSAA